jgi:WD40 repeat protein
MALSPDGRRLLTLGAGNPILWDTATGTKLISLRPEQSAPWNASFSPDGRAVALGLPDGGIVLWDLEKVREQVAAIGLNWADPPAEPAIKSSVSVMEPLEGPIEAVELPAPPASGTGSGGK